MTQAQVATASGLSQATVSKLENGLLSADDVNIDALAKALAYPREFFLSDIADYDFPAVYYRKKKSLVRALDEKAIRARVNIQRRGIARLLQSVDIPEVRVPLVDLQYVRKAATDVARDVRAQWGLPRGPIENVTRLLERAGVVVVPFEFGIDSMDGLSIHRTGDGIPPMIFVRADCPGDRMRFTLLHELAHLVLHHHLPIPPEDAEREADAFAAELGAPAADIRPFLTKLTLERLGGLKRHWGLSMLCILKRAEDLGRISEWNARQLWMQTSKLGYQTKEPIHVQAEEQTLLSKVLRVHMDDLGYSEDELRRAMQGDVAALRRPSRPMRAVK